MLPCLREEKRKTMFYVREIRTEPPETFENEVQRLPHAAEYILFCHGGGPALLRRGRLRTCSAGCAFLPRKA